jgi:hypothetical protein
MKSIASIIEGALLFASSRLAVRRQQCSQSMVAGETRPIGWVLPSGDPGPRYPLQILQEERVRHLYILGATGSGKTNFIMQLLARDIADRRTVAVIDLRGDLVDKVLARLDLKESRTLAKRIQLLDLRDSDRIIGFNPLIGNADPHSRAYLVKDAIKAHSDSWGVQLDETLRNALIPLAEANLSLLELEPFLTDHAFRQSIGSRSSDPSVASFFGRYDALSAERQQAWFLPVLNKVTPLLGIPRLRLLFGSPNCLDFKYSLDTPGRILLVVLGVDRFHSAARLIGSLIIGAIECASMARVDTPEQLRNPVNFYVDEFETMATAAFSSIIAEGRRFGLALTLSHQNLSQIDRQLRDTILNNSHTQIFFSTGGEDARKLISYLKLGEEEDPVQLLQSLPIGQAFMRKRPSDPVLIQIDESKPPPQSPEALVNLISHVHEEMGSLSATEAQAKIASRRILQEPVEAQAGHLTVKHTRRPRRAGGETT